jgi:hypothetical protein
MAKDEYVVATVVYQTDNATLSGDQLKASLMIDGEAPTTGLGLSIQEAYASSLTYSKEQAANHKFATLDAVPRHLLSYGVQNPRCCPPNEPTSWWCVNGNSPCAGTGTTYVNHQTTFNVRSGESQKRFNTQETNSVDFVTMAAQVTSVFNVINAISDAMQVTKPIPCLCRVPGPDRLHCIAVVTGGTQYVTSDYSLNITNFCDDILTPLLETGDGFTATNVASELPPFAGNLLTLGKHINGIDYQGATFSLKQLYSYPTTLIDTVGGNEIPPLRASADLTFEVTKFRYVMKFLHPVNITVPDGEAIYVRDYAGTGVEYELKYSANSPAPPVPSP